MKKLLAGLLLLFSVFSSAQKRHATMSLALTNNQTALPVAKFAALFSRDFHPGVEAGYSLTWKTAVKYDWYQSFHAGYFYHRFVQHGIPLYSQMGFRYKTYQRTGANVALGLGYLHSIPATAVFELKDGEYKNGKGVGRSQALVNFGLGIYHVMADEDSKRPYTLFLQYQQQLQTPFVKSYVPILPYNKIVLGISIKKLR